VQTISCIALTPDQRRLLAALTDGPRRADQLDPTEVEVLRRWGWVFGREWVELTGAGHYHAGTVVGGLVGRSNISPPQTMLNRVADRTAAPVPHSV
jgi:hypothetical protein